MNILICSDGTPASDGAAHLGGMLARATKAPVTLLGIVEDPADDQPLRQALDRETGILRQTGVELRTVIQTGEPTAQILGETSARKYDLIVIGSRRKNHTGHFWQSQRTYEIIKAVEPPVLVAIGAHERLSRILLCSGGKRFIDDAVRLTAILAAALRAEVTLFHIMAEPPAIYAHLIELEEDVAALLASRSELGRNLAAEKKCSKNSASLSRSGSGTVSLLINFWRKCGKGITTSLFPAPRARAGHCDIILWATSPIAFWIRPSVRY
jgi:Universal stress protein UspA and related nucleotide-binding proteins